MTTSIKITALPSIGGNISYTTLVPVVNMTGTPETQKANVQLVGNIILENAGGPYFPAAAQSILAQAVTNAAQPNITSLGTLTTLDVTGDVTLGEVTSGNITTSGNVDANTLNVYSVVATGFNQVPLYTALSAQTLTGFAGAIIAITDSPITNGRIAFWDTTNSRWSYVSDNNAV